MTTKIFTTKDDYLETVCELLNAGEVVALPTATVYGLCANALNEKAVVKIFEAKNRPCDNPLIVHIANEDDIFNLVTELPQKAKKCIDAHLISPEKAEWLRYGIEKRLTTTIVGIPFIIIAVILSNTGTAIAFFFSYFFLRGRTNGYHSKTVFRCLVTSLALEIIFIGFLSKFITGIIVIPVILLVTLTVFLLAPYNDPNMALSEEEYKANQRGSRIRCGLLCLGCILFWSMHYETLAAGIALGGAMAGVLLCVAYILEWRNNNGKITKED